MAGVLALLLLLPACLPGERSNDPLPDVKSDTTADAGKTDTGKSDTGGDTAADATGDTAGDAAGDDATPDARDDAASDDAATAELPTPTGCFADADCAGLLTLPCHTTPTCNVESGLCETTIVTEGTPCDVDNPCLIGTTCDASGGCTIGKAKNCSDGNDCTWDACSQTDGSCLHAPIAAACNDGDKCTHSDHCEGTTCVGSAVVCAPSQNPCEQTKCESSDGKCYPFQYAQKDNHPCTPLNQCDQPICADDGSCGVPKSCDDKNPCTYDGNIDLTTCACVPTLVTNPPECMPAGQFDAVCQLAPGSTDVSTATCVKTDKCDDKNACTDDSWTGTNCAHVPKTKGTPCDDGFVCTGATSCDGKTKCTNGTLDNTLCADGNVCTTDKCSPALGCVYDPVNGACKDGDGCTTGDTCTAGKCSGTAVNCDDGNACTIDSCVAPGGCTHTLATDGTTCGTGAACALGICKAP